MTQLMTLALNENASIEKLERLMELQSHWELRAAEKAFYHALSEFQSNCPIINKTGKTYNGTDYAKLEDISNTIKGLLSSTGLGYRFEQQQDLNTKMITVSCIVSHKDGFSKETSMSAPADTSGNKNFIQAIGSTITYLKRYTLTGALGIAVGGEDNDGEYAEQAMIETYPAKDFNENFPFWEQSIKNKEMTADNIIKQGNDAGIYFSNDQLIKINSVKAA
jgi:hypothetical protein